MPKIFDAVDRIRPAYDAVYKAVLVICKLLLIADILITSYAVAGRLIGFFLVALAQRLTHHGIDTHANTRGKADQQILHREGHTQSSNRTVGNPGHIEAVHHIVKGLHQHGNNHGQSHGQQ